MYKSKYLDSSSIMNAIICILVSTYVSNTNGVGYGEFGKCKTREVDCRFRRNFPNFDGSCNNMKHHAWGAVGTPSPRLLRPTYNDGVGGPRTFGRYRQLPSARKVSNILNSEVKQIVSKSVSHLHTLFGQLLAHDIVHSPVIKHDNGTKLECKCEHQDSRCFNIPIPSDDEQYLAVKKTCISVVRSKAAVGLNMCEFSRREQLNTMSSYIDATFLYGKSAKESNELRDPIMSGEIKMVGNTENVKHKNLPNQFEFENTDVAKTINCPLKKLKPATKCLVAGDIRANENPGLISFHTIMARYHNHVAKNLKRINSHWNSNKIYNTARSIISALVQSISYREYLPLLLGPTWMRRFDLYLSDEGYWNGYDSRYDAGITNEFTTAAFRYGHSQVKEILSRPDAFFRSSKAKDVKSAETFWEVASLFEKNGGGPGSLMRGFMINAAETSDVAFTDALRNRLFKKPGELYGDDLLSINIQRGRDHGFQGYNAYRGLCGLPVANSFSDLITEIPVNIVRKLELVYESVHDIDLYAGGMAEKHVDGGEVGPTFACILAYGFRALRKGDRFWHENQYSPTRLTQKQLATIRQTTSASILCDSTEDTIIVLKSPMKRWQRNAGTIALCNSVPKLAFSEWRDVGREQYNYRPHIDSAWTPWFVTDITRTRVDLIWHTKRRLLTERANEICGYHSNYEVRKIRKNNYFQIRFLCTAGMTHVTDFPYQLNQNHYWTQWVYTNQYQGTQNINKFSFQCNNIVDLQAMVVNGDKYATETGDIFKNFSPRTGFTCRDEDQPRGWCEKYKVRALCKVPGS